ncbi:MAG: hypothetical protein GF368_04015 [Candidatus Aenigmarchaeota archaeon]|nr:hypothetical protein [Candidatus Aenigmarchaeota archaeon]
MSLLESFRNLLFQQGIYEFYFPFLLTFAIFYALIRRTQVFGNDNVANKISLLVSLIAAFYVMAFSPVATPISQFFSTFFAGTSILLVTILSLLMITMMLFGPFWNKLDDMKWWGDKLPWFIGVGLLLTLIMFVASGGIQLFGIIVPPNFGIPGISGEDIALIAMLVLTGVIIFGVQGEVGEKEPKLKEGQSGG